METKREIRRRIRQKRLELSDADWARDTERIALTVFRHPWFLCGKELYLYVDHGREAGTCLIMEEAFRRGKNVWVPRVEGKSMHFYRIRSREELRPGSYGILEPVGSEAADGGEGLMLMPGVAFDERRGRVGYGGGYYDRYLEAHPKLRTMGLAFEFQVLPEVPWGEHDIRPSVLVTEKRVICDGWCE